MTDACVFFCFFDAFPALFSAVIEIVKNIFHRLCELKRITVIVKKSVFFGTDIRNSSDIRSNTRDS